MAADELNNDTKIALEKLAMYFISKLECDLKNPNMSYADVYHAIMGSSDKLAEEFYGEINIARKGKKCGEYMAVSNESMECELPKCNFREKINPNGHC